MGVVKAVCTSNIKGIQKTEQDAIELKSDWGIEGDAHGGPWHRQVSLLALEKIEEFKKAIADLETEIADERNEAKVSNEAILAEFSRISELVKFVGGTK